ncbi:helix-turn-helix domain-containing protein [Defluviimonas aestuarii]|uniref:helix-turn-helix domain-containing protein n=1 Tax=Albidovulum aestuarii TaxID=1130726 RepID=UPI00249A31E6|nr:helix-turn-helix domain-containing protein [Defluviimonas aestuarii]MDI3335974.1 helix-turn-helix domain-containing protein [Defluviimonas aestuarii]
MRDFSDEMRLWRKKRHLSQLDLALAADVSARHVSFLESRRAKPSKAMVLKLAEALGVPRAERNTLLTAAGFAPHYPDLPPDHASLAPLRAAMERTIARHDPFPAVIMDRLWRLIALNRTASVLFAPLGLGPGGSLLDALPQAAAFIENWAEVGWHTMQRLCAESARAGGLSALDRAAEALSRDPVVAGWTPPVRMPAVLPTIYRAGGLRLSLFSTYAQFGTAEEVTLADMKIEMMFPADAETEAVLTALDAG